VTPLAALAAALLTGASPFVAEQPRVREGNEKLLSGDAAGALERYQAAEQEAGPHPEIDFDRGDALQALGRHDEARQAWQRALERDQAGTLSSRALQNMGNALDAAGDHEGAARALTEALRRDPGNEDARYNLEVLLRRKGAGKGKPRDEGEDGARKQQGPPDQGQGQQPKPDEQQHGTQDQRPDPARQPGPKPDQGQDKDKDKGRRAGDEERRDQGKEGQPGERKPGGEGERSAARPDGLGKQDAERLLDALRARERNMPLGPAGRKDGRKREVGRDW
jgi:Ca-activated chloride channel family protein